MSSIYHSPTSAPLAVYNAHNITHTPLTPYQQNQILAQTWLWVPHMKCSLHNDPSVGTVYLILEISWNGYSKACHLQPIFNIYNHSQTRRGDISVAEVELRAPASGDDDGMRSLAGMDALSLNTTGRGYSRREEVGAAGRALGIGLNSAGEVSGPQMKYQNEVVGYSQGSDDQQNQQQTHPQQTFGNERLMNGNNNGFRGAGSVIRDYSPEREPQRQRERGSRGSASGSSRERKGRRRDSGSEREGEKGDRRKGGGSERDGERGEKRRDGLRRNPSGKKEREGGGGKKDRGGDKIKSKDKDSNSERRGRSPSRDRR